VNNQNNETINIEEVNLEYNEILEKIKKAYKPRLKSMSKGQLISIIVELSTQIAMYKASTTESTNDL
jgi:ERCC4-related helicase